MRRLNSSPAIRMNFVGHSRIIAAVLMKPYLDTSAFHSGA
jgi:hypothetical protein